MSHGNWFHCCHYKIFPFFRFSHKLLFPRERRIVIILEVTAFVMLISVANSTRGWYRSDSNHESVSLHIALNISRYVTHGWKMQRMYTCDCLAMCHAFSHAYATVSENCVMWLISTKIQTLKTVFGGVPRCFSIHVHTFIQNGCRMHYTTQLIFYFLKTLAMKSYRDSVAFKNNVCEALISCVS